MDSDILYKVARRIRADKNFIDECKAYDDINNMTWELPKGLAEKTWAVKFISPMGHNAVKTATNIFNAYDPKYDVTPYGPEDAGTAEDIEQWIEWFEKKAGSLGETEPNLEKLKHSVLYNRICVHRDFLPYWLPKNKAEWSDEQKEAVSESLFCDTVYLPHNIRYERGKYGLLWVAVVSCVSAPDIIGLWERYVDHPEYGKGIQGAIDSLNVKLAKGEALTYTMIDYTDKERRYVVVWEGDDVSAEKIEGMIKDKSSEVITVLDGENEIGFINWAIVQGSSDALLSPIHKGDIWVNSNRSGSVLRSDTYRRTFYPLGIEEGAGGNVETDYSGDYDTFKVPIGTKFTPIMNRPAVDPAFAQITNEDNSLMGDSLGLQNLGGVRQASNVQFATINAVIQLMLTDLEPYKRSVEKIDVELSKIGWKWVRKEKYTAMALRTKPTDMKKAGSQITIGPDDFDLEKMNISVKLIANTPTDKMQMANLITMLKSAGIPIPDAEQMERLGYQNPDALKQAYEQEQIDKLVLGLFQQLKTAEIQQQIQAANTPTPPTDNSGNANIPSGPPPPPGIPGGPGNNPAEGGQSPANSMPQATQTTMRSMNGRPA